MAIDGTSLNATQTLQLARVPVGQNSASAAATSLTGSAPVTVSKASVASTPPPEAPDIKKSVESINRVLRESQRNLSFSVDESTGKTVVRVIRESTGELVRQFPSDEVLAIAASLSRGESFDSLGIEAWS